MKSINKISQQAFTLIELLVVIAILGVLASGVLVAIDPIDKINAANDARVQSDIATLAGASEAYAAANNGYYPGDSIGAAAVSTIGGSTTELRTGGELKVAPAAPTGYTYYFYSSTGATPTSATTCIAGRAGATATCKAVSIIGTLKSKKFTGKTFQRYDSLTGKTCQVVDAATACP